LAGGREGDSTLGQRGSMPEIVILPHRKPLHKQIRVLDKKKKKKQFLLVGVKGKSWGGAKENSWEEKDESRGRHVTRPEKEEKKKGDKLRK